MARARAQWSLVRCALGMRRRLRRVPACLHELARALAASSACIHCRGRTMVVCPWGSYATRVHLASEVIFNVAECILRTGIPSITFCAQEAESSCSQCCAPLPVSGALDWSDARSFTPTLRPCSLLCGGLAASPTESAGHSHVNVSGTTPRRRRRGPSWTSTCVHRPLDCFACLVPVAHFCLRVACAGVQMREKMDSRVDAVVDRIHGELIPGLSCGAPRTWQLFLAS